MYLKISSSSSDDMHIYQFLQIEKNDIKQVVCKLIKTTKY